MATEWNFKSVGNKFMMKMVSYISEISNLILHVQRELSQRIGNRQVNVLTLGFDS